ncbi:hypothetical protein O6H91_02G106900 [Diphasiastrum complanatum]|nr:hypothetical protein O6H91_02G106900 [Diphasiastrum complanatum]
MGLKEVLEFKREVLAKKIPLTREITFQTNLFGSKTFFLALEPLVTKDEKVLGINATSMDFTDQVARREKWASLREEVAVQRAMESELHRAIQITEETTRAKQMLATMSHEIRSPLSGVVSMAEILAVTKLDSEQLQLVAVMRASGSLVLQLINDILDLSKVESGAMKLEASTFKPRDILGNVLQMAAPCAKSKNLSLEGFVATELPLEVIGDALRVRQVLVNLVSNAIKFTHEGTVGIIMRVAASTDIRNDRDASTSTIEEIQDSHLSIADDHNLILLQCIVFDTGIGIPDAAFPSLFDKYKQVSKMNARKGGGTGLGLAICKQLVELMGGRLTVESKENEGSIFFFTIRCKIMTTKGRDTHLQQQDRFEGQSEQFQASSLTDNFRSLNFIQIPESVPGSSPSSSVSRPFLRAMRSIFATFNSTQSADCRMRSSISQSSHELEQMLSIDFASLTSENVHIRQVTTNWDEVALCPEEATSTIIEHGEDVMKTSPPGDKSFAIACESIKEEKQQISCTDSYNLLNSLSQLAHHNNVESRTPLLDSQTNLEGHGQEPVDQRNYLTCEPAILCRRKPNILLAEDNLVNIMVAQSMLSRLGLSLEVVYNGAEAVIAAQNHRYDLILMDICMPVMDGLEATRLIRKYEDETLHSLSQQDNGSAEPLHNVPSSETAELSKKQSRQRTPIVAVTANALADDVEQCYAQGMDYFVAKPMTFEKLKQVFFQFVPWFVNQNDSFITVKE